MKLGIILNTTDPETAWNALRLGDTALDAGNEVTIFLMGNAVEIESIKHETFDVAGALPGFLEEGGKLLACGTCLKLRHLGAGVCFVSSMVQLVDLISTSDKVVTLG